MANLKLAAPTLQNHRKRFIDGCDRFTAITLATLKLQSGIRPVELVQGY